MDKLADDKHYGPKVMAKVRYLILLYVAGRLERFRIFGLQEGNNIYFSARILEKIANDRCFRPEKIKFERSRAIENYYLPRVGDGMIIHIQREVPTKKDSSKSILTDLVTLTEKGNESCQRMKRRSTRHVSEVTAMASKFGNSAKIIVPRSWLRKRVIAFLHSEYITKHPEERRQVYE
ncbi:MAG: DUF2080 family transposase-associated protein [Candidatus Nitrosopolaris sp.]